MNTVNIEFVEKDKIQTDDGLHPTLDKLLKMSCESTSGSFTLIYYVPQAVQDCCACTWDVDEDRNEFKNPSFRELITLVRVSVWKVLSFVCAT